MISRRSALFTLGSLLAGAIGLVTTGAFSTVEAERTASVSVAGDASALLQITPVENPDGTDKYPEYLTGDGTDGTINIDITDPGVNDNAVTEIDQLLNVTNNGSEKVTVGFAAEYAQNLDEDDRPFDADDGEVRPYGYTHATNEAADVALVLWASPKEKRMDDTYATVRPELVTTGFDDSTQDLVDGGSSRGEIVDTVNGGTNGNGRKIDPGERVNVGLVIDTRDETIDQNGGIPDALNKNISLLAERTENVESN
jgi:hypothetical protein